MDDQEDQVNKKILVDEKCLELAYHFLQDFALATHYDAQELAERIQATVDGFLTVEFAIPDEPSPLDLPKEGWKPWK